MIKRIKRVRLDRKAKSKSKSMTPLPARRFRLFGQPQVLEGEDPAAYNELLAHICDAIGPVDTLEEMFIVDVVSLEWEVLRWRRLKVSLIQALALKGLETFLVEQLESNYDLHAEHFESYLAKILQDKLPEDQADSAEMLAAECTPLTDEGQAWRGPSQHRPKFGYGPGRCPRSKGERALARIRAARAGDRETRR
jgi:hypothetical protein